MPERPPVLDDVNNAQQLARFLQWMADKMIHLDECMDELKVLSTKAVGADMTHEEGMASHLAFHRDAERSATDKRSVWKQQGKLLAGGVALGGATVGLAVKAGATIIAVFK